MIGRLKSFLLENKTNRQTVAKNTFWLTFSNIGGRLLRAGVIIYAARVLGAYQWGIFNYAITIATFCTLFADLGMGKALWREVPRAETEDKKFSLIGSALVGTTVLALIYTIIIAFIAPLFVPQNKTEILAILPIVAIIVLFDTLRESTSNINRATEHSEKEAAAYLLTNILILIAGSIFLLVRPNLISFAWAYAVGTAVGFLFALALLGKTISKSISKASLATARALVKESWAFTASALFGATMINLDIVLIGIMRGAEDVGIYSAANRIVQMLYLLPAVLSISVTPMLSRIAEDKINLRKNLEKIFGVIFLLSVPIAIGGIITAGPIIQLIFGNAYSASVPSLQVLLLIILVDFPISIVSTAIFVLGKQKNLIAYSAIAAIINVVGDLLLIPKFGIVGSAVTTLVAQSAASAYLWTKLYQVQQYNIWPTISRIILQTIPMVIVTGILVFTFRANALVAISSGAAIYIGVLIISKDPLLKELLEIVRLQKKTA